MRSTLLFVLLTACAASAPAIDDTTYPYDATAARVPEPTPREPRLQLLRQAPTLTDEWLESWIAYDGFPAISTDREVVVVARRLGDGGRGFPNLFVEAYRVADGHSLMHVAIVDPNARWIDSQLSAIPGSAALHEVRARFDEVGAFLKKKQWRTLEALVPAEWPEGKHAFYHFTNDGGVGVRLREPELVVDVASEALTYVREVASLSAPSQMECQDADDPTCECDNPAYLNRAWIAGDLVVAEVAYEGTDLCWEPEARYVFERLPKTSTKGWLRAPRDAKDLGNIRFIWEGLDLPQSDPNPDDRQRAQRFLDWWQRRAPEAPEVKAAEKIVR